MVKKGWGVVFLVFIPLVKKTMLRPWCSIDSSGKKCHILDMRYVNMQLYKDKIKFDYWKCFENYLLANKAYVFKFDGYHHFDIFDSHSWLFLGYQRGYKILCIHCLTLWLILCTISFYKSSKSFSEALAFARSKSCFFLDDDLGIAYTSRCSFLL